MNTILRKWFLIAVVFTLVIGSLLHFVYEWSGKNELVGIFSAVNESTWEHLKMIFWSSIIFSFVDYFFLGKQYPGYFVAKAISFYTGITLIVTLYYTYTGMFGEHFLWVDLLIFAISAIASQYICYHTMSAIKSSGLYLQLFYIIVIILLFLAFALFTFSPPRIPMFQDPLTGSYGI